MYCGGADGISALGEDSCGQPSLVWIGPSLGDEFFEQAQPSCHLLWYVDHSDSPLMQPRQLELEAASLASAWPLVLPLILPTVGAVHSRSFPRLPALLNRSSRLEPFRSSHLCPLFRSFSSCSSWSVVVENLTFYSCYCNDGLICKGCFPIFGAVKVVFLGPALVLIIL
jgi:hypothetical protein